MAYRTPSQPDVPDSRVDRDGHPPVENTPTGARGRGIGRLRRLLLYAGMALALLSAAAPTGLRALGHWLIVEDELAQADAIFVHAGHLPFRAIEAAGIHRDGFASEVWLAGIKPTPESEALLELGIEMPPGHYWRTLVLNRLGVPRNAVRILSGDVLNTRDEVELVANELQRRGLTTAILVTSKQHSRRVQMLWERVAPDGVRAIVRPSESDPFDPDAWWTNTEDGQAALHEFVGIAAIWIGWGLRPERSR